MFILFIFVYDFSYICIIFSWLSGKEGLMAITSARINKALLLLTFVLELGKMGKNTNQEILIQPETESWTFSWEAAKLPLCHKSAKFTAKKGKAGCYICQHSSTPSGLWLLLRNVRIILQAVHLDTINARRILHTDSTNTSIQVILWSLLALGTLGNNLYHCNHVTLYGAAIKRYFHPYMHTSSQ